MDFISDKMHTVTGGALSGVNEMRRKRSKTKPSDSNEGGEPTADFSGASAAVRSQPSQSISTQRKPPLTTLSSQAKASTPLGGGIPFGGDSYSSRSPFGPLASGPPPPPIGFRTDLFQQPAAAAGQPNESASDLKQRENGQAQAPRRPGLDASSESLYQADAWARLWFQRVMLLCFLRLLLFIRKVYEDFQATKVYNLTGQTGYFLLSATTLFLPTIIFTVYRVSRYLQVALPPLRAVVNSQSGQYPPGRTSRAVAGDDESQLTRALMSSPVQSVEDGRVSSATQQIQPEDEGLVTARQTPTNLELEQYHDSKSQQGPTGLVEVQRAAPATPKLESINVDKLGDLPDKDTMRVFSGASEQLLHGVLFIFWQLKRQVDVMGYLVERACLWRKPAEREKEELDRLRTGSDGLEWFHDFYAAFLAILAQVYTLISHWSGDGDGDSNSNSNSAQHQANPLAKLSATTSGSFGSSSSANEEPSVSQAARVVSGILGQQAVSGSTLNGKDVLLMSELIVSSAVVVSLLICVRRRDDGILTLGLSMLGWGSLFAARIIIIALAFVHIGWHIMLPLVVVHILCLAGWVYKIALDSHNGRASELVDEAKWDPAVAQEAGQQQAIELLDRVDGNGHGNEQQQVGEKTKKKKETQREDVTSGWSTLEHVVLLAQIVSLFAIPSLFYWPIMFNLKLHNRPAKYLSLILTQNFLLVLSIWLLIVAKATSVQLLLLFAVVALSLVGFVFVLLYVLCKPSLTEHFARADTLFNEAESCGIYYEFCSRVFKMPDLSKSTFARLMKQSELVIEEDETEVTEGQEDDAKAAPQGPPRSKESGDYVDV